MFPNMNQEKKFGALSSSVDPQKLAATVTGFIKLGAGLVAYFGLSSISGDINSFAEQAGQLVTIGYAFFGAAEVIFGLARKIIVAIQQKVSNQ